MASIQYLAANPKVLKTLDDWATILDVSPAIPAGGQNRAIVCPDLGDGLKAIVGGTHNMLRYTVDGGTVWSIPAGDWTTLPLAIPNNDVIVYKLQRVGATGTTYGFAFGGIIKSTDNGATFNKINVPVATNVINGHFFTVNDGVICLQNGGVTPEIYITADGGASWNPVSLPTNATNLNLADVWMHSATHFVIAAENVSNPAPYLFTTFDGGASWTEIAMEYPGNVRYWSLKFLDTNTGFFGSQRDQWLKTTNGGLTWNIISANPVSLNAYYSFFLEAIGSIFRAKIDTDATGTVIIQQSVDTGVSFAALNVLAPGQSPVDMDGVPVPIPGCTNPISCNYNPAATVDDASCILPYLLTNCQDPLDTIKTNTDLSAEVGNVIKIAEDVDKCFTVQLAGDCDGAIPITQTDSYADCPTCVATLPVPGCTDPLAINFDPLATVDDGSCVLVPECSFYNVEISGPNCAPDCAKPGEGIKIDVGGTIDAIGYPATIIFTVTNQTTGNVIFTQTDTVNDDTELDALEYVYINTEIGHICAEICIPGCTSKRQFCYDVCQPFDIYKDECNNWHIQRPHETTHTEFLVRVTSWGGTDPEDLIVDDVLWDITTDLNFPFVVTGDGIYVVELRDPADPDTIIYTFAAFEYCKILECMKALTDILFCSVDDPCCVSCDGATISLREFARIQFNKLYPLYLTILSLAKKDKFDHIGMNLIDDDRMNYITKVDEIWDKINEVTKDCSGICQGLTNNASNRGDCPNC